MTHATITLCWRGHISAWLLLLMDDLYICIRAGAPVPHNKCKMLTVGCERNSEILTDVRNKKNQMQPMWNFITRTI